MISTNPSNCSNCGAKLDPNDHFCEQCGARVESDQAPPPTPIPPSPIIQTDIPPAANYPPQDPISKKRSFLWIPILALVIIFCVILAGGSVILLGKSGLLESPTSFITISDNKPENTVSAQSTSTVIAQPEPTQDTIDLQPTVEINKIINEEGLSKLVFTTDEVPDGWTYEKYPNSGLTNEQLSKTNDNPAERLKYLNSIGRITNLKYDFIAPGDHCGSTALRDSVHVTITLYKNKDNAQTFYDQNFHLKKGSEIGEQSTIKTSSNDASAQCPLSYIRSSVSFKRYNIIVELFVDILDNKMSEQKVENLAKDFAKTMDNKILNKAQ